MPRPTLYSISRSAFISCLCMIVVVQMGCGQESGSSGSPKPDSQRARVSTHEIPESPALPSVLAADDMLRGVAGRGRDSSDTDDLLRRLIAQGPLLSMLLDGVPEGTATAWTTLYGHSLATFVGAADGTLWLASYSPYIDTLWIMGWDNEQSVLREGWTGPASLLIGPTPESSPIFFERWQERTRQVFEYLDQQQQILGDSWPKPDRDAVLELFAANAMHILQGHGSEGARLTTDFFMFSLGPLLYEQIGCTDMLSSGARRSLQIVQRLSSSARGEHILVCTSPSRPEIAIVVWCEGEGRIANVRRCLPVPLITTGDS